MLIATVINPLQVRNATYQTHLAQRDKLDQQDPADHRCQPAG
jgi:hypothetical protein